MEKCNQCGALFNSLSGILNICDDCYEKYFENQENSENRSCQNCENNKVHLMGNPCSICINLSMWKLDYFALESQLLELTQLNSRQREAIQTAAIEKRELETLLSKRDEELEKVYLEVHDINLRLQALVKQTSSSQPQPDYKGALELAVTEIEKEKGCPDNRMCPHVSDDEDVCIKCWMDYFLQQSQPQGKDEGNDTR